MGVGLLVVFGGLVGWNLLRDKLRKDYLEIHGPGPTLVSTAKVEKTTFQPTLSAVGTIKAAQQTQVTSETGGKVEKIAFRDGQQVEKGELLVVLEDEVQRAQLQAAVAQRNQAADAVKRYKPLAAEGAISELRFDELQTKLKEAQTQVSQANAALSFVRVTAPFAGRLGIRQVSIGQLVQPGTNIVTIDTEGSLYCDFTLPESHRNRVFVGQKVALTSDVAPKAKVTAKINAIDPEVATATRTFGVRAILPSKEANLTPGSFANVEVQLKGENEVLLVPRTAIAFTLYGDSAFVLDESTKAEKDGKTSYQVKKAAITSGPERGESVVITRGLEAGQLVVTSGQLRLEEGDWVTPQPDGLTPPKGLPPE